MILKSDIATLFLRFALASGFLSAVASRLNFWGKQSSGWESFINYTAQVNAFIPKSLISAIAITVTILELTFGLLLLIGFQTNYVAFASGSLTMLFAIAMTISFGIKESFDYSVFVFSAAAFLLANCSTHRFSLDQLFNL
ncbi:MAG: DoxX family membrane protein [Saprospiraceae bacterium]|nr:DoxX family membrane protein [Saprospiraceae bacterium]